MQAVAPVVYENKIGGWVPACAEPVIGPAEGRTRWLGRDDVHFIWDASTPAERIVALVFPITALVVVGHFHRDHVFRVLESKFCRHPDLHRIAIGAGQD